MAALALDPAGRCTGCQVAGPGRLSPKLMQLAPYSCNTSISLGTREAIWPTVQLRGELISPWLRRYSTESRSTMSLAFWKRNAISSAVVRQPMSFPASYPVHLVVVECTANIGSAISDAAIPVCSGMPHRPESSSLKAYVAWTWGADMAISPPTDADCG